MIGTVVADRVGQMYGFDGNRIVRPGRLDTYGTGTRVGLQVTDDVGADGDSAGRQYQGQQQANVFVRPFHRISRFA